MAQEIPLELEYARDVMRVYQHIQRGFGDDPEATEAQRTLLDWVTNPENKKEFFKSLVPQAAKMLAEAQKGTPKAESLLQGERKKVEELQFELMDMVRGSNARLESLLS